MAWPFPLSNQFTILDIPMGGVAMGTFAGLSEGAQFNLSPGRTFQITYHGGDGNDVVLTQVTVPQPATLGGLTQTPFDPVASHRHRHPRRHLRRVCDHEHCQHQLAKPRSHHRRRSRPPQLIYTDSLVVPMRFYRFALL